MDNPNDEVASWFSIIPISSHQSIWGYRLFFTEDEESRFLEDKYYCAQIVKSPQHFIDAIFCKRGANSMITFIERLRESNNSFTVTEILSTRCLELMTHHIAHVVIQCCFNSFRNQPNMVLYEMVIYHFRDLAIHRVGCRSLNGAIDTISGEQRTRLLNLIVDSSVYLSNDQYGNYVVQHVLSLGDENVSAEMLMKLRGHFVELSMSSGGSHIVEQCMDSSRRASFLVVIEIVNTRGAPVVLALDKYGNYVIQKALVKTKEHGLHTLYDSLVGSLRPYRQIFNRTSSLRNLVILVDGGRLE